VNNNNILVFNKVSSFLECRPLQSPQMGGYSQIITGTATCFEGNQEDLSSCG